MKQPTPLTDAFLEELKSKMDNLKIKKAKFARSIGTSKQNANKWLTAKTQKPSAEFILKIQEWLKTV